MIDRRNAHETRRAMQAVVLHRRITGLSTTDSDLVALGFDRDEVLLWADEARRLDAAAQAAEREPREERRRHG